MRLARIAWIASLCFAFGCGQGSRFVALPLSGDMASAVLGVFEASKDPELFLSSADNFAFQEELSADAVLVVTAYPHKVSQFAWPPGPLPVLPAMTADSRLPPAAQILSLEPGGSRFVVSQDDRNASVPLAAPNSGACLLAGSCYADVNDVVTGLCSNCQVDAPAPVQAPAPLAWQGWSECPDGASVVDDPDLGIRRCELPASAQCTGPSHQGVFDAMCVSFDPCPGGRFAQPPANMALLYVDADAAPGGDGLTGGSPLTSLAVAAARATDSTVILIAPGSYDVPQRAGRLNLLGVCPERTRLLAINVASSTLSVDNVTLETDVVAIGHLEISDCYVEGGIQVSGSMNITNSVVEGAIDADATRISVLRSTLRGDVSVQNGSDLRLDTTHFGGDVEASLTTSNTGLRLSDVRIQNAKLRSEGSGVLDFEDVWFAGGGTCEQAVVIATASTLNWRRVDMSGAVGSFVNVTQSAGVIEELAVHDGADVCRPAIVFTSSDLTVNKVAGARLLGSSVVIRDEATVVMNDAVFAKGNLAESEEVACFTVIAQASLTLARAEFTDQANEVLLVFGEDSILDVSDVVVSRNTDVLDNPPLKNRDARVIEATDGGTVMGRRMRTSDVNMALLGELNSTIEFEDLHVVDSVMSVRVTDGGRVTVDRLLIEGVTGVGACAQKGATLILNDATFRQTQNFLTEGRRPGCPTAVVSGGTAVAAGVGSQVALTRFVIDGAATSAFLSVGEGLIVPRHGRVSATPIAVLGVPQTRLEEFLITVFYEDVMRAFVSLF